MTQRDMAGYLGITTVTLRNWRKNKPHLYEIVLKGFAFDKIVEQSKKSYEEAVTLQGKFKSQFCNLSNKTKELHLSLIVYLQE